MLRGKTLSASAAGAAMERGVTVTSTLLLKDTAHKTVFPAFTPGGGLGLAEMQGAADILMVPDQSTFRVLPWAPDTGWFLCDLQFPDGRPVPFSTRGQLRKALDRLESVGYEFVAGLEVEFHVFKITDQRLRPEDAGQPGTPPEVELLTTGYQLLTEHKYDQLDGVIRRAARRPGGARAPAALVRARIRPEPARVHPCAARRHGSRGRHGPAAQRGQADRAASRLPRHLHVPAQAAERDVERLAPAPVAHAKRPQRVHLRQGGPLRRRQVLPRRAARPCARRHRVRHADHQRLQALPPVFARPRPRDLGEREPRRHAARDRRPRDPDTRIENRIGEPAANPYLYFASQIYSGLDGIERRMPMARPADTPYEAKADFLPRTLEEALQHLKFNKALRDGFGSAFIDYYCRIKEAEIARFNLEVSDWEHRDTSICSEETFMQERELGRSPE